MTRALFGGRQPHSQENEQRSDGAIQEPCDRAIRAQPFGENRGKPRQNQTPDRSSGDEREAEDDECRDFCRRSRIDELRKEGEEKQRHFRV